MSIDIKILSWSVKGFRCPDHEINLRENENNPYKISLIQMPNGTGKTTTLNLLQAALSGSAKSWSKDHIMEFKKRNGDLSTGEFYVQLKLNDEVITIFMEFDFKSGGVTYKTTNRHGQTPGFKPPRAFEKFLSENSVKFYVFDGELADKLLNKNYANASDVIKNLFQLTILDSIAEVIDKHWGNATKQQTSLEERGLNRAKNEYDEVSKKLSKCELHKQGLEKEIESETKEAR